MLKFTIIPLVIFILVTPNLAKASSYYSLAQASISWDGTDASRFRPVSADYTYAYGDEAVVSYTLPWQFNFYGQAFTQVNADTNGNVWFGSAGGPAYRYALTTTGPVAAGMNDDLSSRYRGGVFIQHKTDPERIVIEWQTDSYAQEGEGAGNNSFEIVLFQSGVVRADYRSFTTTGLSDAGSGLSKGDGVDYPSVTQQVGDAYLQSGKSFSFTPSLVPPSEYVLTTTVSGDGSITVSVAGGGNVVCGTGSCEYSITSGSSVLLIPVANTGFAFNGWSGACAGSSNCSLSMDSDKSATAGFTVIPNVRKGGAFYGTIGSAYAAVTEGEAIDLKRMEFIENLLLDRGMNIILRGGFTDGFASQDGFTTIIGTMTIGSGSVVVDRVIIK